MTTEKADIRHRGDARELWDLAPGSRESSAKKQWLHAWSTPERFAAHVATLAQENSWHASGWTNEKDFTGTANMEEALDLAFSGWPEGAKKAAELRDKISATLPMAPRFAGYDVAGAYPSVPRALAGNPLNMRKIDSLRSRRRPVLTLISDASASSGENEKTMLRRAALTAALIDAIEDAGYAAHVVTAMGGELDGTRIGTAVCVKQAGQAADIGRLAFGLGHPSLLRRLSFAAWTEDKFTKGIGGGLGVPTRIRQNDDMRAQGIYVLPSANEYDFHSDDIKRLGATMENILNALARQQCPAFADRLDREGNIRAA